MKLLLSIAALGSAFSLYASLPSQGVNAANGAELSKNAQQVINEFDELLYAYEFAATENEQVCFEQIQAFLEQNPAFIFHISPIVGQQLIETLENLKSAHADDAPTLAIRRQRLLTVQKAIKDHLRRRGFNIVDNSDINKPEDDAKHGPKTAYHSYWITKRLILGSLCAIGLAWLVWNRFLRR